MTFSFGFFRKRTRAPQEQPKKTFSFRTVAVSTRTRAVRSLRSDDQRVPRLFELSLIVFIVYIIIMIILLVGHRRHRRRANDFGLSRKRANAARRKRQKKKGELLRVTRRTAPFGSVRFCRTLFCFFRTDARGYAPRSACVTRVRNRLIKKQQKSDVTFDNYRRVYTVVYGPSERETFTLRVRRSFLLMRKKHPSHPRCFLCVLFVLFQALLGPRATIDESRSYGHGRGDGIIEFVRG